MASSNSNLQSLTRPPELKPVRLESALSKTRTSKVHKGLRDLVRFSQNENVKKQVVANVIGFSAAAAAAAAAAVATTTAYVAAGRNNNDDGDDNFGEGTNGRTEPASRAIVIRIQPKVATTGAVPTSRAVPNVIASSPRRIVADANILFR